MTDSTLLYPSPSRARKQNFLPSSNCIYRQSLAFAEKTICRRLRTPHDTCAVLFVQATIRELLLLLGEGLVLACCVRVVPSYPEGFAVGVNARTE